MVEILQKFVAFSEYMNFKYHHGAVLLWWHIEVNCKIFHNLKLNCYLVISHPFQLSKLIQIYLSEECGLTLRIKPETVSINILHLWISEFDVYVFCIAPVDLSGGSSEYNEVQRKLETNPWAHGVISNVCNLDNLHKFLHCICGLQRWQ